MVRDEPRAGPGTPPRRPSRSSGGFALAAALWVLVLVGAVSAGFLAAAQSERRATANLMEEARARWAARAGLARATASVARQLSGFDAVQAFRSAGDSIVRAVSFQLNGVPVRAALLDSRARLHLNRASGADIVSLLTAAGLPRGRAVGVAAAVLDWRDPDGRPREGGAEAADYAALGLPARPPDAPLADVEELRDVMGVDEALFRRLRPLVTVVGDGRINVNSAPAPLLAVLPGLDPAGARAVASARRGTTYESAFDVADALPSDAGRRLLAQRETFGERAAYGPRFGEIVVAASPRGSPAEVTIRGVIELQGGRSWRIVSIRED